MPSFLQFNHPLGGLVNLSLVQVVRRGDSPELGQFFELKFIHGDVLIISQKQDEKLYRDFTVFIRKKISIWIDLESDKPMKIKGEGELE